MPVASSTACTMCSAWRIYEDKMAINFSRSLKWMPVILLLTKYCILVKVGLDWTVESKSRLMTMSKGYFRLYFCEPDPEVPQSSKTLYGVWRILALPFGLWLLQCLNTSILLQQCRFSRYGHFGSGYNYITTRTTFRRRSWFHEWDWQLRTWVPGSEDILDVLFKL